MKEWLYTKEPLDINDNMRNMILATLPFEYKKDKYINAVCIIVHRLSNMPWYTQELLMKETELNKEELIKINKVIRDSDYLQHLITKKGTPQGIVIRKRKLIVNGESKISDVVRNKKLELILN